MRSTLGRFGLIACMLVGLTVLSACAKREHRVMRVHQEQHEGEVQEVSPGEMVVE